MESLPQFIVPRICRRAARAEEPVHEGADGVERNKQPRRIRKVGQVEKAA